MTGYFGTFGQFLFHSVLILEILNKGIYFPLIDGLFTVFVKDRNNNGQMCPRFFTRSLSAEKNTLCSSNGIQHFDEIFCIPVSYGPLWA